jgi:hypothetical protein
MAVIRYARKHGTQKRPWLGRLIERRPTKVAAVALANKIAQKMRLRTRRSFTRGTPRGLFGSIGLMATHS